MKRDSPGHKPHPTPPSWQTPGHSPRVAEGPGPAPGARRPALLPGHPSGCTRLSRPQKTSFPARTAASGTAASGTYKPTSCTTAPAARAPAPPLWPPPMRSPRRPTPTSGSAPSPSAAKAAPAPAPWRSTCAATAVSPAPNGVSPPPSHACSLHCSWGCTTAVDVPEWSSHPAEQPPTGPQATRPACDRLGGRLGAGPPMGS